jgi:pimeloyl-ACP methyl ester carboxylesterase
LDGRWTHRTVRANGIAMHVAEMGVGAGAGGGAPLVLLLHGFPQFWWTWRQQMADLADAGFRAVAVDLRGYGASDKPPRGYDIPTLTSDIASLVTALGENSAMIVGNDIGGLVAWSVAARHPSVVRSLAILGTPHPVRLTNALAHDKFQRSASAYVWRTFQIPRRAEYLLGHDDGWVRELFGRWTGPRWRGTPNYEQDVARYAEAMRIHPVGYCAAEMFRWMWRSVLRRDGRRYLESMRRPIQAPVLQLHGDIDECLLARTAQGSGQFVSAEYEWRLLEGVGHFPQDEAAELVSGELVRWAKLH